jgi:hypothetical protein
MKHILGITLCVLCTAMVGCNRTNAQTNAGPSQEPKTKLQAFEAKTGVVIIRGFSMVGSVSGQYGGSVSVESREFLDASTAKREFGIVVEVKKGGEVERDNSSYIDYDEIDSLLKGIDYISKVQSSITKLDDFQADYHTKGDFKISTFSARGQTMVAVSSGDIGEVSVFLPLLKLESLRALIANAKAKLDAIK